MDQTLDQTLDDADRGAISDLFEGAGETFETALRSLRRSPEDQLIEIHPEYQAQADQLVEPRDTAAVFDARQPGGVHLGPARQLALAPTVAGSQLGDPPAEQEKVLPREKSVRQLGIVS
jgi:hypothetical protein